MFNNYEQAQFVNLLSKANDNLLSLLYKRANNLKIKYNSKSQVHPTSEYDLQCQFIKDEINKRDLNN